MQRVSYQMSVRSRTFLNYRWKPASHNSAWQHVNQERYLLQCAPCGDILAKQMPHSCSTLPRRSRFREKPPTRRKMEGSLAAEYLLSEITAVASFNYKSLENIERSQFCRWLISLSLHMNEFCLFILRFLRWLEHSSIEELTGSVSRTYKRNPTKWK